MKTKTILLALFFTVPFCMYAQSYAPSDYSNYLNKAMSKLEEGDCATAQKFYNVYKDLSGKAVSSIEILLADCRNDTTKTYAVGDVMMVNNEVYKVAYIQQGGKHGFAVREIGAGPLKPEYRHQQKIPSWSEFLLIKQNNSVLKLDGQYWTQRTHFSNDSTAYECFGLGSYGNYWYRQADRRDILFIHRF